MLSVSQTQTKHVDTSRFKEAHLPFCTSTKVWLAVSSIFLAAGFATIAYCAATHNIHLWTGVGLSTTGLISFIPSVRFISSHDSDLNINIKPDQKILSHGVTFACTAEDEEQGFKTFQFSCECFDPDHFKAWLTQKAPKEKIAIFEKTLFTQIEGLKETPLSISYHKMTQQCDVNSAKPPSAVNISWTDRWYDFTGENETYIDFANAYTFGGGWRDFGHVQEEVLFEQSLKLALLAYLSDQAEITPAPADGYPFTIEDVEMQYKVPDTYYGHKGLRKIKTETFNPEGFEGSKAVTITGIAAKCWTLQGAYYHYHDLNALFQTIYRACLVEKRLHPDHPVVHTGAWGCGAFNNSEKTITLLQMFAAQMAGVNIVFHGIDNPHNPNYTKEFITGEAKEMLEKSWTPEALFQEILDKQTSKEWRTKHSKSK